MRLLRRPKAFPGDETWLIEQLDARDADGMFRKLRVMIVGRKLYPLHLAISRDWKVHYYKADMAQSADNRAKEAPFLQDMASAVGERGMTALQRIADTLQLDYGGIDFAVECAGRHPVFRGQCDDGYGAARSGREVGLPADGL